VSGWVTVEMVVMKLRRNALKCVCVCVWVCGLVCRAQRGRLWWWAQQRSQRIEMSLLTLFVLISVYCM
jgi:hypothetical protein